MVVSLNSLIMPTSPKKSNKAKNVIIVALLLLIFLISAGWLYSSGVFIKEKPIEQVIVLEDVPIFRHDIKAYVISDLEDEHGDVLYYVIRFYAADGLRVSEPMGVATSSVAIDENGVMSIQVVDDFTTAEGDLYRSVIIDETVIDPTDKSPDLLEVGQPCIPNQAEKVEVCNAFILEVDVAAELSGNATQGEVRGISVQAKPEAFLKTNTKNSATGTKFLGLKEKVKKLVAKFHNPAVLKITNKPRVIKKLVPKIKKPILEDQMGL